MIFGRKAGTRVSVAELRAQAKALNEVADGITNGTLLHGPSSLGEVDAIRAPTARP